MSGRRRAFLAWLLDLIRRAPDPLELRDDIAVAGDAIEVVVLGVRFRIVVEEVA